MQWGDLAVTVENSPSVISTSLKLGKLLFQSHLVSMQNILKFPVTHLHTDSLFVLPTLEKC